MICSVIWSVNKLLMAASAVCAGALVGTIAAGFAILFIKIHRVLGRVVKATGLHVSVTAAANLACISRDLQLLHFVDSYGARSQAVL